ncbi:MAG: VOC family protein [Micrococcales bacterium]
MNRDVFAITLATDDLIATEEFYRDVFGADIVHSDEVSRVFKFGSMLINCLELREAKSLFEPAKLTAAVHTSMLTIQVKNVDAEAKRLDALDVVLNTEPTDQPWGIRTITFIDPTGQLWEFSHPLATK